MKTFSKIVVYALFTGAVIAPSVGFAATTQLPLREVQSITDVFVSNYNSSGTVRVGTTAEIYWHSNKVSVVSIRLLPYSGAPIKMIAPEVDSRTSSTILNRYYWNVPKNLPKGQYYVLIKSGSGYAEVMKSITVN